MARTSPEVTALLEKTPDVVRKEIEAVRLAIRKNIPDGYKEAVLGKMIAWVVPLDVYPDTYNKQPLMYAALAAQKNYISLHLVSVYMNEKLQKELRDGFAAAKKKLDMGKGCVRFKKADDLPLDVIGKIIGRVPMERYVAEAKAVRKR